MGASHFFVFALLVVCVVGVAVEVPAGKEECLFLKEVEKNTALRFSYQVLEGGAMDIDVAVCLLLLLLLLLLLILLLLFFFLFFFLVFFLPFLLRKASSFSHHFFFYKKYYFISSFPHLPPSPPPPNNNRSTNQTAKKSIKNSKKKEGDWCSKHGLLFLTNIHTNFVCRTNFRLLLLNLFL